MGSGGVNISNGDDLAGRMASYMLCSKADNTNKKYLAHFNRFKSFCDAKGFPCKPADPIHVAIYMTHLLDMKASFHVISTAFYSIKWLHEINNLPDPTSNGWVKSLLEAGKRLNSIPVKKEDTINTEMLISLCDLFHETNDVLLNLNSLLVTRQMTLFHQVTFKRFVNDFTRIRRLFAL